MLRIFNGLKPFFEDNYRRIYVREYAKLQKISPPSASKQLKDYEKKGLLKKEEERRYLCFFANKENTVFAGLQRLYYQIKLEESGLLDYLRRNVLSPIIILFGSAAKAEMHTNSDIDLAIFTKSERRLDLSKYRTSLKRQIQVFLFKSREEARKDPELLNSILNGHKLSGEW